MLYTVPEQRLLVLHQFFDKWKQIYMKINEVEITIKLFIENNWTQVIRLNTNTNSLKRHSICMADYEINM